MRQLYLPIPTYKIYLVETDDKLFDYQYNYILNLTL